MFEDIVADILARQFDHPNLQRYGRQGQKQYGIDIVGIDRGLVTGVQCKHHPKGNISLNEIDTIVTASEKFSPSLQELYIYTSADRDAVAHTYVLEKCTSRTDHGLYPIYIAFWQDLTVRLEAFPDLVYRHFTKYFALHDSQSVHRPSLRNHTRVTQTWPTTTEELHDNVQRTLRDVALTTPYDLSIGVTTFDQTSFTGMVDLEVSCTDLFSDETQASQNFLQTRNRLAEIRATLAHPNFSKTITIHLHTRLSLSFLFGWMFRKVTGYHLSFAMNEHLWMTNGLPLIPADISDSFPVMLNSDSDEVALVLNISRDIDASVMEFVQSWQTPPKAIWVSQLSGHQVTSASHALSIALTLSERIKMLIDRGRFRHIHLFASMPTALAAMIGYHLNAICPISIYFLDTVRNNYLLGGILENNL